MGQVLFAPALAGCTSDDVTASAAQVLSGYTALTKDSNDDPISGTMTNRGAWTSSSSGSGHIAIPAGYHNGSGYVDCSGAYNAGVTAGVSSVTLNTPSVSGRAVTVTASNGKSATGYVEDKGQYYSSSNNVGEAGTYFHATFPEGYYSSSGQAWAPEIRVEKTTMNSSGWYDKSQYDQHYTDGYNAGLAAGRAEKKTIVIQLTGDKTAYGDLPGGTIHLQSNVDWTVSSEGHGIGLGNSRGTVYAQVNKGQSRSSSGPVWINMGAWGMLTIKA